MAEGVPQSARRQVETLRKQLNHHNYLYYVLNQPEISDAEHKKLAPEAGPAGTQHRIALLPPNADGRMR